MEWINLPPEKLGLAFTLLRPRVPVLITSENADGSTNVAPANWNTPLTASPPLVLLSLQVTPQISDTLLNIRRTGEFVLNLPGMDLAERLVLASYEYAPGPSKFERLGFTPLASQQVRPPAIAECRSHLECRVVRRIDDLGDHELVIGQVLAAGYRADAFEPDMTARADGSVPCVHLGQSREPDAQTHTFLTPGGVVRLRVPYPPR